MALRTNKTAHFLVTCLFDVFSLTFKCFHQRRPGDGQVHGFCIVAIGTANRVNHFAAQTGKGTCIKCLYTFLVHQPWNIRTFAGHAGGWLRSVGSSFWCAGAQCFVNVGNGIVVPATLFIVF